MRKPIGHIHRIMRKAARVDSSTERWLPYLFPPAVKTITYIIISTYSISSLSIYRKVMAGAIYSDAQKSVARAFANARLKAGLKQAELAQAIGKHQSYISDIERGQRRIDLIELYVIAKALKRDPADLYAELVRDVPEDAAI
jgi:DNA-binding XRE family transcriptional regulator